MQNSATLKALSFSPDGRMLVTRQGVDYVRIWDVAARRPLGGPFRAQDFTPSHIVISNDGKILAAADQYHLRFWDDCKTVLDIVIVYHDVYRAFPAILHESLTAAEIRLRSPPLVTAAA